MNIDTEHLSQASSASSIDALPRLTEVLRADPRLRGGDVADLAQAVMNALEQGATLSARNSRCPCSSITLNGYQLSEALELVAPDKTSTQLNDVLHLAVSPGGEVHAVFKDECNGPSYPISPYVTFVPGSVD